MRISVLAHCQAGANRKLFYIFRHLSMNIPTIDLMRGISQHTTRIKSILQKQKTKKAEVEFRAALKRTKMSGVEKIGSQSSWSLWNSLHWFQAVSATAHQHHCWLVLLARCSASWICWVVCVCVFFPQRVLRYCT